MTVNTAYYSIGSNVIIYKAAGFTTGLTVTCKLWDYDVQTSDVFGLTELSDGLYYFRFKFTRKGIYPAVFFEDGVPKQFHTFRVREIRDL